MADPQTSKDAEGQQSSLLDLLTKQLSATSTKPVPLPLVSDDIGGELIAILSKGLYTNPLDCLRGSSSSILSDEIISFTKLR